jgi:hypothetical protein
MISGYGADDRIMDPDGALRLYKAAVNSRRQMMAGLGHPHHAWKAGGPRDERPATLQDWMMKQLRADVRDVSVRNHEITKDTNVTKCESFDQRGVRVFVVIGDHAGPTGGL